jgi:hypothetical protein
MTKAFQLQATGIDKSCGSLAALNSMDVPVNSAKAVGIVGLLASSGFSCCRMAPSSNRASLAESKGGSGP